MPASAYDSFYFRDRYGSPAMRAIWDDRAMVQRWLDVEAALAATQAELGLVPRAAAREIARRARVDLIDLAAMKRDFDTTWNPVMPLVDALRRVVKPSAARWVHWGATSKNIIDTALALQIKATYAVVERELEAVAAQLARLDAPLGTISVLGNHDWRSAGIRMRGALVAAGITVLENDAVRLDGPRGPFWVAGLDDMRHRTPDLGVALRDVPADAPVIVLTHDPDMFPHVPRRVALTLAGHTHGGQVAIPLLRRPLLPSHYGERYAGGHVVEHERHLFVSSGLGTSGLPIRLLAPPEVLVVTLRAGRES